MVAMWYSWNGGSALTMVARCRGVARRLLRVRLRRVLAPPLDRVQPRRLRVVVVLARGVAEVLLARVQRPELQVAQQELRDVRPPVDLVRVRLDEQAVRVVPPAVERVVGRRRRQVRIERVQHLVGDADGPAAGLVRPLDERHVPDLLHRVDVHHLGGVARSPRVRRRRHDPPPRVHPGEGNGVDARHADEQALAAPLELVDAVERRPAADRVAVVL